MIFSTTGNVITTYKSVIDLRSDNSIASAIQNIAAGDYSTETELTIRLDHTFFNNASAPPAAMNALMDAAGRLPMLQRLEVLPCSNRSARARDCYFPVEALAAFCEQAGDRLRILIILNCCLTGKQEHYERLATSVQGLAQLEAFYTKSDCRKLDADEWTNSAAPLSATLQSLTTIPKLQVVCFKNGTMAGDLETAPLLGLGTMPKLRHVQLHAFPLDNSSTAILAQALSSRTNTTITSLVLACAKLGVVGSQALGAYLSKETTKLKMATVTIKSLLEGDGPSEILSGIVYGLGNSGSKDLQFGYPAKERATAMTHFREMLRGNYDITSAKLQVQYTEANPEFLTNQEINFLLETNRVGRGSVLRDDPDTKLSWMDLFDVTKGELDNIYYLVRSHPLKFAALGLRDLSENMTPTNRTLTRLLRGHAQATRSMMTSRIRGVCSSVSQVEEILDSVDERTMELEDFIRWQVHTKLECLQNSTEKFQINQSADLKSTAMQLNARMIGVRDLVASMIGHVSWDLKMFLSRESQDLKDCLEGKLQRHLAGLVASQTVSGFLHRAPMNLSADADDVPNIVPDDSFAVPVDDRPSLEELTETLEECIRNGFKKVRGSMSDEIRSIAKGNTNDLKEYLEANLRNARSMILESVNAKINETHGSVLAFIDLDNTTLKKHFDTKIQIVHENIYYKFNAIKEFFVTRVESTVNGAHDTTVEKLRKLIEDEVILLHASFDKCESSVENSHQDFVGKFEKWQSDFDTKLANLENWQTSVDAKLNRLVDSQIFQKARSKEEAVMRELLMAKIGAAEKKFKICMAILLAQGLCFVSLLLAGAIFFYLESIKKVSISSN